ncbi:MAG: NirA family protein [Opitutaceae bacterium]|nr:NirA family protein [Opitutaceae bacterium]
MSNSFTIDQKKYLEQHILDAIPFLGKNAEGQFTTNSSQALEEEELLYGPPVDELCKEEKIKYERNGLDVWDEIVANAAKDQFPESSDAFRYKFYGLFHVKPAQDSFMLRCRIPGCKLTSTQLNGLAEIAQDWGNGYADITTRGNLQIREIMPRDTVSTLIKLTGIGLTSKGSGADNVRNITAAPTSGFDPQELMDVMPLALGMHHYILNCRDLYGLPRKFNISFDSGGAVSVCADTNDIGFYSVRVGKGQSVKPGIYFRMRLCGITGHQQLAFDSGLLLKPEECIAISAALIRVFIENGNRINRKKARLKYLVDDWGIEKLLEETEKKLAFPLLRAPLEISDPPEKKQRQAHLGVHTQSEKGLNYIGVVIPVGRLLPDQMHALARIADTYGQGDIRLTVWQNLIIPHIPDAQIEAAKEAILKAGLQYKVSPISSGLVACTGNTGCQYAGANTKGNAIELSRFLQNKFELDQPLNIHLTGCPHSCAQHYIGDIGLQATSCKVDSQSVEGYNIVLGGGVDENRFIARDVFSAIPFSEIPSLLENMLTIYLQEKEGVETFAQFTRRHSVKELHELFALNCHA